MQYFEEMYEFVEGKLAPEKEAELFQALSADSEMRTSLKQLYTVKDAAKNSLTNYKPTAKETMGVFAALNVTPPEHLAPAPYKQPFSRKVGAFFNRYGQGLAGAAIATVAIILALYLWPDGNNGQQISQNGNNSNAIPVAGLNEDNSNSINENSIGTINQAVSEQPLTGNAVSNNSFTKGNIRAHSGSRGNKANINGNAGKRSTSRGSAAPVNNDMAATENANGGNSSQARLVEIDKIPEIRDSYANVFPSVRIPATSESFPVFTGGFNSGISDNAANDKFGYEIEIGALSSSGDYQIAYAGGNSTNILNNTYIRALAPASLISESLPGDLKIGVEFRREAFYFRYNSIGASGIPIKQHGNSEINSYGIALKYDARDFLNLQLAGLFSASPFIVASGRASGNFENSFFNLGAGMNFKAAGTGLSLNIGYELLNQNNLLINGMELHPANNNITFGATYNF